MSRYLFIFIQLPQIRLYVSYHAVLNLPTQLLRPVGECIMAEASRPVSEVMRLKSGSEKWQAGVLGSMVRLRTVSIGREKHSMCGHCCKKNAHVWAFLQEVEVPFGVRILGSFLCSVEQSLWVHAVATNGCQQMSFTPWKKSVSSIIQPFDWTAKASINATLFMNKIVYLQNESNWLACRRQALYFQSSFRWLKNCIPIPWLGPNPSSVDLCGFFHIMLMLISVPSFWASAVKQLNHPLQISSW